MLVIGNYNDFGGQVYTTTGNGISAGDPGADTAVGAFTGTSGLPNQINSEADWVNFGNAMIAKQTQIETSSTSMDLTTRKFVGVGGSGDDFYTIHNHDVALVYGRDGGDQITTEGPNDTLHGGTGDDSLTGGGGSDILYGNSGADRLISQGDGDRLLGGAGADTFAFTAFGAVRIATIGDLETADTIDLGAVDANTTTSDVNDAFVQVKHFDGAAGEFVVKYKASGASVIKFDTDGDGVSDHSLSLKGGDFRHFDHFIL